MFSEALAGWAAGSTGTSTRLILRRSSAERFLNGDAVMRALRCSAVQGLVLACVMAIAAPVEAQGLNDP